MTNATNAAIPEGLSPGGRFADWAPAGVGYIVIDVDGTLIGNPPEVTQRVATAVRACAPGGIRIGVATGRMPSATTAFAHALDLGGPHIVHNGAQVLVGDEVVAGWPLEASKAQLLADLCLAEGWYAEFYLNDGYVVTDRREEARPHWWAMGSDPQGLVAELDLASEEVVKATIVLFGDPQPEELVTTLSARGLSAGCALAPVMPEAVFVNVTHHAANKGNALRVAAGHAGVVMERVLAVGDGHNDLPMLWIAGTAIAMGQASPVVKAAAHFVVPGVGDDGLAHALAAALHWP